MNWLRSLWCDYTGHRWSRKGRPIVDGAPVNIKRCTRCGIVRPVRKRASKGAG